mmetsp:Transcript_10749/g.32047  ORF Transcript_10749/g.32047 Transcript_10749/m.32047 type:complete len:262 (+) Transcript_10749:138-923(+)
MLRTRSTASSEMWQRPSRPGKSSPSDTKAPNVLMDTTVLGYVASTSGQGPAYLAGLPRPPPSAAAATIPSMAFSAASSDSDDVPESVTRPSSPMSMLVRPWSAIRALMVSPPLPMILPFADAGTSMTTFRGTESASACGASTPRAAISASTCSRAARAFSRAAPSVSARRPSDLTSSWKAEMPASEPATLKSMDPSASSTPRMSVSTTGCAGSSKSTPMATPATGVVSGTPASYIARQPPQTDAMLLEPQDSVMSDSTRTA